MHKVSNYINRSLATYAQEEFQSGTRKQRTREWRVLQSIASYPMNATETRLVQDREHTDT